MQKFSDTITSASRILIIQADNPDADSLGSALALEDMLGNLGKEVFLYCAVNIPDYLRYLPGWDRVTTETPKEFDLSIFVDVSTYVLFDKLTKLPEFTKIKNNSSIVIDHHGQVEQPLDFANISIVDPGMSSAGELVYHITKKLDWPISDIAAGDMMMAILGDTQGLSNELTTPQTYRTMAELSELGGDRLTLEDARRERGKMAQKIYKYKAELINRTEFSDDGSTAHLTIPQSELDEFSPLYNPIPLIQPDILQTKDVVVSIIFKTYDSGRVTASIRSVNGYPIADKIASSMGGGGHPHASGFKIEDGRTLSSIKDACLATAAKLIQQNKRDEDEIIQYTF